MVAESTNVRKNAGDASELAFSLNKGVEVEISEIRLVDENIWGKITSYTAVSTGDVGEKTGWINLASKYVKRTNEITLPEEEKKEARQNAILAYQNEELSQLRTHYSKPKPSAKQDTRTQSLFDL